MNKYQNPDGASNVMIFPPLVRTATPALVNTPVADFACVEFDLYTGVGGITNKLEWIVKHGDTTNPAEHTAVEAADLILPAGLTLAAGGIVWALVAEHAAAAMHTIEYVGGKANVSIQPTFGGTHNTGTSIAAKARRSRGRLNPPA
ncbi:MAG TPA: hypothetical protein PKY87_15415 [Terricaulis sp.]|nr:hypothetical protein [Terricaulis sp.]